jgi:hypothetical protein
LLFKRHQDKFTKLEGKGTTLRRKCKLEKKVYMPMLINVKTNGTPTAWPVI